MAMAAAIFGLADLEQRAGARRFQHHLVAAPAHVGKPRQDENVGIAEPRRSRPIIGNLRFDNDLIIVRRASETVLQQAVSGQSPHQQTDLLVDVAATGRKRSKRQTGAQAPRAIRGGRAERPQADRIAVEAGR